MLERDVILSKISIIQNGLKTIKEATKLDPKTLEDTLMQDAFVLNIQRAVQACIDMANVVISAKGFRLPTSYRESFKIIAKNKLIENATADKMIKMVGFRNIAIHEYQEIDINILKSILQDHLSDFEEFYSQIYKIEFD